MGTTRLLYWLIALLGPVLVICCGGTSAARGQVEHSIVQHQQQHQRQNQHSQSAENQALITEAKAAAQAGQEIGGRWHTVGSDENLREIAAAYYGSSYQWRIIQLSNDVSMYPNAGSTLWIPASADAWFAEDDYAASLVTEVRNFDNSGAARP